MTHKLPIITVTGTKGKTTVVSLVASYLRNTNHSVLHVDTSGHFMNGMRKSTAADSRAIWGIGTVTAAPGRYLFEFVDHPEFFEEDPVAVLESSFSSSRWGLGYKTHKVGIFLNVFEDHIDPRGLIKTRSDLARAKSFVFSSIEKNGYAVFNADDEYVCSVLDTISSRSIELIPCGKDLNYFDIQMHLKNDGKYVKLEENKVVLHDADSQTVLADLNAMDWAFNGAYEPLALNIMYAAAGLYAFNEGNFTEDMRRMIENTSLDPSTGRMVVMKAKNGATIIADFAHEKHSLQAIADLGRKILPSGGKLRAVVRLSHERPDDVITDTGNEIGRIFDDVVVYDKIDGHFRKPRPPYIKRYPQVIGRTSEVLAKAIRETNPHVERIVREDEAIESMANHTGPQDVVIVIANDEVERSLGFMAQSFQTEHAESIK